MLRRRAAVASKVDGLTWRTGRYCRDSETRIGSRVPNVERLTGEELVMRHRCALLAFALSLNTIGGLAADGESSTPKSLTKKESARLLPAAARVAARPGLETGAILYSVHACIMEGETEAEKRMLAEPTVVAPEGRDAVIRIGGAITVGSETAAYGVMLHVRVTRADSEKLRIAGTIERSEVTQQLDGFAVIQGTRAVLDRVVVPGATSRFTLPSRGGNAVCFELTVDEAPPR
jgi:hypothetical protein